MKLYIDEFNLIYFFYPFLLKLDYLLLYFLKENEIKFVTFYFILNKKAYFYFIFIILKANFIF